MSFRQCVSAQAPLSHPTCLEFSSKIWVIITAEASHAQKHLCLFVSLDPLPSPVLPRFLSNVPLQKVPLVFAKWGEG